MAEDTKSTPAPAAPAKANDRKAAVEAWHDADTEEKRKAAVKKYPVLASIYSEAQNYK